MTSRFTCGKPLLSDEQGRRLTNAFLSELRTLGIADNRPVLKKEMYFLFSERVAGNARPTKKALPLVLELTNDKAWGPLLSEFETS